MAAVTIAVLALADPLLVAADPLPDIPGLPYRATFVPNAQPASKPAPAIPDRLPDIPPILGPPKFGPPATAPAPTTGLSLFLGDGTATRPVGSDAPASTTRPYLFLAGVPSPSTPAADVRPELYAEDEALVRLAAARLPSVQPTTRSGDAAAAANPSGEAGLAATRPAATQPASSPFAAVGPVAAQPATSPAGATRPAWWLPDDPPVRESVRAARWILVWDPFADDETLAAAVAVLAVHDPSMENWEIIVRSRISKLPDLRPTKLARAATDRGGDMLTEAVVHTYAWDSVAATESAWAVLRRLEAADPAWRPTTVLARVIAGPDWNPGSQTGVIHQARALAIVMLDHADERPGADPRPLSPVATAAIRECLYGKWSDVAAVAADALLRRRLLTGPEWDLLRDHGWSLLNSDVVERRAAAIKAMAPATDKPAIAEAMTRALRSPEPWARWMVVRGLLDARPQARAAFARPLAQWMAEEAWRPQPPNDVLLGTAAERAELAREQVRDAFENATGLLLSVAPLPADTIPSFGALLASTGQRDNGEMLLAAGGPAALPTLDDLYQRHKADADPAIVAAVARVLSQPQLAGPEAEERLLTIFGDGCPAGMTNAAHVAAAAGLGRARHRVPEARKALAAVLATDDLALRAAVADALATLGPSRDVPPAPAADLVRRGTSEQRAAGAKLLGAMGGRALGECAADLARMADNVNPVVRWSAAAALTQVDAGGAYTGRAVVAAVRYQDSVGLDKLLGPTGLGRPSPAALRVRGDRRTMLSLHSLSVDHPNPAVRRTAEDAMDRIGE